MGMRRRESCCAGRLSMKPGSTLFMRMFSAAYLSAKSFVKAATPERNTPKVGKAGSGSKVAKVVMLTMEPERWRCMTGVTSRVDRKSVVSGKSVSVRVDLGGRRIIKKKKKII